MFYRWQTSIAQFVSTPKHSLRWGLLTDWIMTVGTDLLVIPISKVLVPMGEFSFGCDQGTRMRARHT